MIALYIILGLIALGILLIMILNCVVNNHSAPASKRVYDVNAPHTVLAVFAHPDDEVMVAGSLARLKRRGHVHALYCTHGEDGPTGGLVEQSGLGAYRETELKDVASILGYDSLEILDYPDRYLNTVDADILKSEIKARIERINPDTVICFDDALGLYGHTDHAFSGKCTQELLAESSFGVQTLLVMTLCDNMISLAKKVSKTFRERFDDDKGLPAANFAIRIPRYANKKMSVVKAHRTQWQVMNDVQPLYNKIPAQLYYRIFSREYYHLRHL